MRRRILLAALVIGLLSVGTIATPVNQAAQQPKRISATEAKDHIGERLTVCGLVADSKSFEKSHMTLFNFERKYPDHVFTMMLLGAARKEVSDPEHELVGRRVCVTGLIANYQGKPEVKVTARNQITIER